jgi:formate-dependent nitrite reductase membrane component NrfD
VNFFVADPEWGVWIIAYFFLGGIAAGAYFVAVLIEWFGTEEDAELARVAYWLAFPLVLVCAVLLIVDLERPERFWHMLLESEVVKGAVDEGFPATAEGWRLMARAPAFKYWSPMSLGSWVLGVFGACSFVSFLIAVRPNVRAWRWLRWGWPHRVLQVLGCAAGFFIASYTGALLSATNQPVWSDTTWLGALFLASAASTALAAMTLIAWWRRVGTEEARTRLAGAEPYALGLELVVLGAFLASLGGGLAAVLQTTWGNILVFGTLVLGILTPLLIHGRISHTRAWALPAAAGCALVGGLLLRCGAILTPPEMLARGPAVVARFAPEADRQRGESGADIHNYRPGARPRSKLLERP